MLNETYFRDAISRLWQHSILTTREMQGALKRLEKLKKKKDGE